MTVLQNVLHLCIKIHVPNLFFWSLDSKQIALKYTLLVYVLYKLEIIGELGLYGINW